GDLRVAAPEAIKPDVDQTVDLVDAVIGAVRADSRDPAAAADRIRSGIAEFPDAQTAGLAAADDTRTDCGVELSPGRDAEAASDDRARSVIAEFPDAQTAGLAVADYARPECDAEINPAREADAGSDDVTDDTVPPAEAGDDGSVTGGM